MLCLPPPFSRLSVHPCRVGRAPTAWTPSGATTNSANGVTDVKLVVPTLKAMAEQGVPLCVHGEVTDPETDLFDREALFIEQVLKPLLQAVPDLRVIMEHITTEEAVEFVTNAGTHALGGPSSRDERA